MLTECTQDSFDFGTVGRRAVVGAFDGGKITSDAGALLLGQADKAIRLVSRLAACFQDSRSPSFIVHALPAMLSQTFSASRSATRTSSITTCCATIRCSPRRDTDGQARRLRAARWQVGLPRI